MELAGDRHDCNGLHVPGRHQLHPDTTGPSRGDFEPVRKDDELKTYAGIVLAAIVLIILGFGSPILITAWGNTLRHSSFQVVSVITTTGFTTVNYDIWPPLSRAILLLLMFVGGCGGSTGGGMKVVRINVLAKHSIRELKRAVYPRRVSVVRLNDKAVPEEVCSSRAGLVILYLSVFPGGPCWPCQPWAWIF